MNRLYYILIITASFSCNKVVDVKVPAYESQITVEMYLQDGAILSCLLSESLPYTDTAINRSLDSALVVFSDGQRSDTLANASRMDMETGRWYNYVHHRRMAADAGKTYTLTITDKNNRKVTATTRFSKEQVKIDSLSIRRSENNPDSFSLGVVFTDPVATENYYRALVIKDLNDYKTEHTDLVFNDVAFNGKPYSFFSEQPYAKNDTVTVRIYSLTKDHFEYLQSTNNARISNFNPFTQPSRIASNITGGLGIFTSTRFDQRKVIIR